MERARAKHPGRGALSAEARKQVFLVCSRINKKRSVAGVESEAERVVENEAKVKGYLFMTLCAMLGTSALLLRREAVRGVLRGVAFEKDPPPVVR